MRRVLQIALVIATIALAPLVFAETNDMSGAELRGTNVTAGLEEARIEVTADRIEYVRDQKLLMATGNVVVKQGDQELRADRAVVQTDTNDVWATGNVILKNKDSEWRGERLYCNLDTGRAYTHGKSSLNASPFRISGRDVERTKTGEIVAHGAWATTCALAPPHNHYHIRASRMTFVPGKTISARHIVFYFWGWPVLYLPYWKESSDGYGLTVRPGYTSGMGVFALTSYGYVISENIGGRTHLDYRTERGFATGQDIEWHGNRRQWTGNLKMYYAHDTKPIDDDDNVPEGTIPNDRYRVLASHQQKIGERTRLFARLSYLSDTDILEDFFRSQYRQEPRPENYVSLNYRADDYTARLLVRGRLNGFYEAVTRLPEAALHVPTRQIGDTRFYYEGHVAVASLKKVEAEDSSSADYSSVRIDSRHELSLAGKIGPVVFVPMVAYRGTAYSKLVDDAQGEDMRSLLEVGAKTSVKAFKILRQPEEDRAGVRHMIEPYARYVYVPEPNLLPSEILEFDSVDELGAAHGVVMGVRNSIQVKRNDRVYDVLDLNMWTYGALDAEEDAEEFSSVSMNAELRLAERLGVDFDGEYNFRGSGIQEANAHVWVGDRKKSHADIEYRYRDGKSNHLLGNVAYDPGGPWTLRYAARYGLDSERLEEQTVSIRRNYDCMYAALGVDHIPGYTRSDGSEREEEYRFVFTLLIKAFPDIGITLE